MIQRFHQFHPVATFVYYLGAIALLMIMLHPLFLTLSFFIILIINIVHDGGRALRKWMLLILTTGIFLTLLNPLFNERGRTVVFEAMNHRVTIEALVYGGVTGLSIMGVMMIFVSYNEVMTPNKLLFLFSRFLPSFAVLLMLTLRFIPLMRRRLAEISAIQQSKGIMVTKGKWKERVSNGMSYIQVLLTYSLEEAIQTANSMKARGYGNPNRTAYEYFHLKKRDIVAICYLVVCFIISVVYRMKGLGHLTIYPVMETLMLTNGEVQLLGVFILFIGFPLWIEGGGYVKWHILK